MTSMKQAPASIEARLQRVEDELAIMRALNALLGGADGGATYGPVERRNDYVAPNHTAVTRFRGVAEDSETTAARFRSWTPPAIPNAKHMVTNPVVTFVNGDEAKVESYFTYVVDGDSNPRIQAFGRYVHSLKKGADGKWRIQHSEADVESRTLARQKASPPTK